MNGSFDLDVYFLAKDFGIVYRRCAAPFPIPNNQKFKRKYTSNNCCFSSLGKFVYIKIVI